MKQIDEWGARKRRVVIEYVSSRHRKADGQEDQRVVCCDGQVNQVWKEGDFRNFPTASGSVSLYAGFHSKKIRVTLMLNKKLNETNRRM